MVRLYFQNPDDMYIIDESASVIPSIDIWKHVYRKRSSRKSTLHFLYANQIAKNLSMSGIYLSVGNVLSLSIEPPVTTDKALYAAAFLQLACREGLIHLSDLMTRHNIGQFSQALAMSSAVHTVKKELDCIVLKHNRMIVNRPVSI